MHAKTRFEPSLIGPDTYVIHDHHGEGEGPVSVPLNAMVIRGAQPVVIDTGMPEHRDQFLEDVFGLVDPEDLRWVVISHDDIDHTGNLGALMDAAPNAVAVLDWFMTQRMGASLTVPLDRQRWLRDGEGLDVGDRVLQAVRPPVYDSPTTRGVFDPSTGVYWSSDAFATPMAHPVRSVAELDPQQWEDGRLTFDNYLSPWLALVDQGRFQAAVDRVAALSPTTIVGCHTPVIGPTRVAKAIEGVRGAPGASVPAQPDQTTLELLQATLAEHAA